MISCICPHVRRMYLVVCGIFLVLGSSYSHLAQFCVAACLILSHRCGYPVFACTSEGEERRLAFREWRGRKIKDGTPASSRATQSNRTSPPLVWLAGLLAVGVIVHTGANWAIISIGQDDKLLFNDADLFRHAQWYRRTCKLGGNLRQKAAST